MAKKISPLVITEQITHTYHAEWFRRDFARMSDGFKRARSGMVDKMNRCFGCNWPFQMGKSENDGEIMHLVSFSRAGNKLICEDCLNKIFGDKASLESWGSTEDKKEK